MDLETVYNMARAAARGAEKALNSTPAQGAAFFETYAGYPAYVEQYNRLLAYVYELCGEDAKSLFPPMPLGKAANPFDVPGGLYRTYLETAYARLSGLAAYLQSRVSSPAERTESLIDLIRATLRAAIHELPRREAEVQNAVETILRARQIQFRREAEHIPYSSKVFVPDFTLDAHDLALEVKLCDSPKREREIVDELNADIPAYQSRYRRILFVVFDVGAIRDVLTFQRDIENNPDIFVEVVKW